MDSQTVSTHFILPTPQLSTVPHTKSLTIFEFYSRSQPAHKQEWGFHNARVNCVAWSPDSKLVASGSLDTTIIIWSLANPSKHTIIKNAHPQSQITRLVWLDNETVISTGQDCNTKVWNIEAI